MSDPASLATHDDRLSLRDRMRVRAAEAVAATRRGDTVPVVTVDRPSSTPPPTAAAERPSANSGESILADLKRAQALRDRLHMRAAQSSSPTGYSSSGPTADEGREPTRDVYHYQQPFPVQTVFDLERVRTSGADDSHGHSTAQRETLLMGHESAAVLRALEQRLGQETERAVLAERRLDSATAALERTVGERDEYKKKFEVAEAMIEDMKKDKEKLEKAQKDALEAAKKEQQAEVAAAKSALELKMKADITKAEEAAKSAASQKDQSELDRRTLEALVAEMKEQLSTNGIALQNQTMTIRELTEDVLSARAQVTNLSVALQDKEREVKSLKADVHAVKSESAKIADLKQQLKATQTTLEEREAELQKLTKDGASLPELQDQLKKSQAAFATLEQEHKERLTEMQRLRKQVESVRTQADAAYLHSAQFHGQADGQGGPGMMMGYGGGGGHGGAPWHGTPPPQFGPGGGYYGGGAGGPGGRGGAPAGMNQSMDALRREIEEEEKRAQEEQRRFRSKMSKAA